MEVRLQKIIAGTGLASRRKAEEWIAAGRVTVNGKVVTELGTKVDPDRAHIKVDGKHISATQPYVYLDVDTIRIDLGAELRHHLAVDGHAPSGNPLLSLPPRSQSRSCDYFL